MGGSCAITRRPQGAKTYHTRWICDASLPARSAGEASAPPLSDGEEGAVLVALQHARRNILDTYVQEVLNILGRTNLRALTTHLRAAETNGRQANRAAIKRTISN